MNSTKAAKKTDPNHLGFGRLMLWKSSDITAGWVNLLMLNYLSIYASDTLGVSVGVVGTLLLASKIVDSVTDLLAGWIVDNTHTKLGKARPYELCIIGMTICTILLFSCSPEWSETVKLIWIFCMYTLAFSVFTTLRQGASNPYTIRHFSNNPVLLKKVASFGGIVSMAGSMFLSIIFPMLMQKIATSAEGWTRLVAIIMIPGTIIGVLRFIFCKEDPKVDEESSQEPVKIKEIFTMFAKNKYVWLFAIIMLCYNIIVNLAAGTYFFKWVIGDVSLLGISSMLTIVLLPLMAFFPKIMAKLQSMGKMIFIFCIIGVVGYTICFLGNDNFLIVMIGFIMGQFAILPLSYYGILFIMNICTYNEIIGLPRMDGSAGILSNFSTKVGGALGAFITGALLQLAGYVSAEGVTSQPDSAILMIRVVYAILPLVMIAIIGICSLAFSKLEPIAEEFEAKKHQEKSVEN
ncbi:MAG: MFS transporter [Lachnospiraceae bacterium]|nr:MFS transporter [Lachnospiraceae bacterium]